MYPTKTYILRYNKPELLFSRLALFPSGILKLQLATRSFSRAFARKAADGSCSDVTIASDHIPTHHPSERNSQNFILMPGAEVHSDLFYLFPGLDVYNMNLYTQ